MGGFRIRDVEVNGDIAFEDRMEVSVKVEGTHLYTYQLISN